MARGLVDAGTETNRVGVMRKTAIDAGALATDRIGKSSFKMIE